MRVFLLHRKVPSLTKSVKEIDAKELVRKVLSTVKVMTMLRMTEKVKSATRKLAIQGRLSLKQAGPLPSLIRIHLEEVKRKVRVRSPESKLFIGPGD
ncbi:hypothetical protein [Bacillus marasmi]|uniref:hypothetical protein n=1 Tax=Bacillus marasmi TaxID=1926279 RepID=UPI0011C8A868|nr:hypothetical protein [Bacillus marasmi]